MKYLIFLITILVFIGCETAVNSPTSVSQTDGQIKVENCSHWGEMEDIHIMAIEHKDYADTTQYIYAYHWYSIIILNKNTQEASAENISDVFSPPPIEITEDSVTIFKSEINGAFLRKHENKIPLKFCVMLQYIEIN